MRPLVQPYYEVRTNVPVGDIPREAGIVLLHRRDTGLLTFCGLWEQYGEWLMALQICFPEPLSLFGHASAACAPAPAEPVSGGGAGGG
jgi:hypothetical protein